MNGKWSNVKRLRAAWLSICLSALMVVMMPVVLATPGEVGDVLMLEDLIELKRMGFPEESIRKEVTASSSAYDLTVDDVSRMQRAGFSVEFIDFLKSHQAGGRLDNEDLGRLLSEGMPLVAILKEIQQSERDFDASPRVLLSFHKQFRAPKWLMRTMRGHSLSLQEIKEMGREKVPVTEQLLLIDILGVESAQISTAQMLNLLQTGVSGEVVRKLRNTVQVPVAESELPRAGYYPHALGLFTLHYPNSWQLIKEIEGDYVSYVVTPEQGAGTSDDLDVALQVMVSPMDPESVATDMTPVQVLEQILPMVLQQEPGLRPDGDPGKARLGELPAAQLRVTGSVSDKEGLYTGELTLAFRNGLMVLVMSVAPEEEFSAYSDSFSKIVEKSSFLTRSGTGRSEVPIAAQEIVTKYQRGIVSVLSYHADGSLASGTGFIIREDGYLLTNHHVIWDNDKNQPATRFIVEWDPDTGLPKAEAKLLNYRLTTTYQEKAVAGLSSGIDIALLKLPEDRQYTPLPLVSTDGVRLADPVLTIGFPARDMIRTLSTIVTSGIVTRLNKDFTGKLESIYIDAPIAHGSSGGPALDLMHGRVFGLNTFSSFGISGVENLWNYFGVIPIDYVLNEFPIETQIGQQRDQVLEPTELYDLALHSRVLGATVGALAIARRAKDAAPESADTNFLVGRLQLELAETQEDIDSGLKRLDHALSIKPNHLPSLMFLAQAHLQLGDLKQAQVFADRAVKAYPSDPDVYETRVLVYLADQKYDQALADVGKAKQLTQKVLPSPYLLAGETYYAMKHYGEGRREFEEAVRIHPVNLNARIGIARYYDLTEQPIGALLEYNKIQRDFPGNPVLLTALGRAYQVVNKPDKALESYLSSIDRSKKLGLLPLPETYLEGAQAALSKKTDSPETALALYLGLLGNYWEQASAFDAHLGIAQIFQAHKDYQAIALGHLVWALALREGDREVTALMRRVADARLSFNAIKSMINNLGYPVGIAARVIKETPLDFRVKTTQQQMDELQKELPGEVAMSIFLSQEKYQERVQETTKVAIPNALLGTWLATLLDEATQSYAGELHLVLEEEERYLMQVSAGNEKTTERGTFKVIGDRLRLSSETGEIMEYQFEIRGKQLVFTGAQTGDLIFTRVQ